MPEDLVVQVLQEGLCNVERHAEAAEVIVTLAYAPERVEPSSRTTASGSLAEPFGGVGLRMLRDEVRKFGGEIRFSRNEDAGSTMRTHVPL